MSGFPAGTGVIARKEGSEYAGTTVGNVINQGGRQYYIVNCTQQKVLDSEGNNVWQPMRSEEKDFHAENVEQTQKGRVAKFAT